MWGHLPLSGERFDRERPKRGVLEREESQGRILERETPKRRILWRNLTEKKPKWSVQKKYSPSIQVYRAYKELWPSSFLQGKKGARISRKKDTSTNTIECYQVFKHSIQTKYSNMSLWVTSESKYHEVPGQHQILSELTKCSDHLWSVGDISKFLCSQCFHDGIVLESIVLFLIRRIKCDQPFSCSVFRYHCFFLLEVRFFTFFKAHT
jgi:hypothetical protein